VVQYLVNIQKLSVSEVDEPCPENIYGLSKLLCEKFIREYFRIFNFNNYTVVRSWDIIGKRCKNNIVAMLRDESIK